MGSPVAGFSTAKDRPSEAGRHCAMQIEANAKQLSADEQLARDVRQGRDAVDRHQAGSAAPAAAWASAARTKGLDRSENAKAAIRALAVPTIAAEIPTAPLSWKT